METRRTPRAHEAHEPLPRITEEAARALIDAAITIHRALRPVLLESVYEVFLAHELQRRGHEVVTQAALPIVYDTLRLDGGYRIDLIVDGVVIVEVKSVEALAPIHGAQLLTYLKLSNRRLGFLINFNAVLLKQGVKRMIL